MIDRLTAIAAPLSALALVFTAGAALAQEAATLEITFSGISQPTGAIYGAVYDSEAAFKGGKGVRSFRIDVTGPEARQTIADLPPGRYAIKLFHDVDGDGKMSTNPFGMPTEPYAASNNAKANMGPPTWEDAAFDLTADGAAQTITID
ncbi:MAG: DUF2141 domain-containing protein [Caulobacter sp.]|jgi:uncharacterized protein (DUF2141 family)